MVYIIVLRFPLWTACQLLVTENFSSTKVHNVKQVNHKEKTASFLFLSPKVAVWQVSLYHGSGQFHN